MKIKHLFLAATFFTLSSLHTHAATFTVTNTNDSGAGSLRQTIAGAAAGDDIEFRVTGTITLKSGQLVIDKNLTIRGPGAGLLSISGNNASRVFYINAGVTAEIGFVTIRDGHANDGAGITNAGTLAVSNSIISGNSADLAGGIRNFNRLTVINSTFSGNTARFADGAFGNNGTMTVSNTTISDNTAGGAGAVWNGGGLTFTNSTISGNKAAGGGSEYYDFDGGAIYNEGGTLTINNSTISGNTAIRGGGIFSMYSEDFGNATVYATNSTMSGNNGGGIFSYLSNETLRNTIVAGNTGPAGDITGIIETASHNLIGDAASSGGITNGVNGNIVGVNPLLGPLQNNGGTTPTHALLAGSPAIDKGLNRLVSPVVPAFDQRAAGFARIRDGNGDSTPTVDIGAFEVQSGATGSRTAPYDFDGDGRADVSVFRPSDRVWYLNRSTAGFAAVQFGLSTDKIVPADYDGDGRTDIAVFRDGIWYWLNSSNGSFNAVQFGLANDISNSNSAHSPIPGIPSDIPVPGDYTGDGRSELAVYRGGTWWMLNLTNGQVSAVPFGLTGDEPVAADYDGDGRVDQAVYRAGGEWYLNQSTQGFKAANFGLATDRPVPADYDGDGKTDFAVYRDGTWYLLQSTNGFAAFHWGLSSDVPVPADYDGDGKTDAAIYRNGQWWLLQSTVGISIQQFGQAGDKPLQSAFIP